MGSLHKIRRFKRIRTSRSSATSSLSTSLHGECCDIDGVVPQRVLGNESHSAVLVAHQPQLAVGQQQPVLQRQQRLRPRRRSQM